MTKVSVLMPVYNVNEKFLKESIESIINQSFTDFELIILDDGSKGDVETFIKSFDDSRIKFYKNPENLGVSKTRNKLMDMAQGEYIAWQDADDIAYTCRLEKQVKFLETNKEFSAVGSWLEKFPNTSIKKQPEYPKIIDFLQGCMFSQPSAMLRISDFRNNRYKYNEDLVTSEDYDLWARSIGKLLFYNIQEPLLKYRQVTTSLCHTKSDYAYKIDSEIKQRLLNILTSDMSLQKKIIKLISNYSKKKISLAERLFSIRNEWDGLKKYKIMYLLGIKIKLLSKSKF